MDTETTARVFTCEGCGGWTNEPVTEAVLLATPPDGWGWTRDQADSDNVDFYCEGCSV